MKCWGALARKEAVVQVRKMIEEQVFVMTYWAVIGRERCLEEMEFEKSFVRKVSLETHGEGCSELGADTAFEYQVMTQAR